MSNEPTVFVGIDWATEEHVVCVLDQAGKVTDERSIEHTGGAIQRFVERLTAQATDGPASVAVAIEIPRGALVETLVERGFRVFAINPKQLDRFRDRFFPSGAKDDSKDAFVLGRCLMTDRDCYREVRIDEPTVIQLREHVRMHDDLKQERNRHVNRLRDLLIRYFPDVLKVAQDADDPWVLEILERAPTPAQAARLHHSTIAQILKAYRIRRVTADQVVDALRARPLNLAEGSVEAASAHVTMLLPRIRLVHAQQRTVQQQLDALLEDLAPAVPEGVDGDDEPRREHRDVEVILSMPGAGTIITATMLGEAAQAIRDRDYLALRAHAGIAPVTKQTGKARHGKDSTRRPRVSMRHGCNGRLRNALYNWARVASQFDPASKRYYAHLRARGHTHGRALRSAGDRLLRILFAMLRDGTRYDPTRFKEAPAELAA